MIPPSFDYHAPRDVNEAVGLLKQHGADAKILAGGMSLIPLMKLRLASPAHLIDINRIPGLDYIKEENGFLRIGALAREADLEKSELVQTKFPILVDTAVFVGDPLVRNRATLAGNLAHADPANDHPATMLVLGAEVAALGPEGERTIPIGEFFVGLFATALNPDEMVTEVRIPIPPALSGGAYLKVERKVGDFATAGVAVQLTLGRDDAAASIGIGLTNVGPMAIKARNAEQSLSGKKIDAKSIAAAARLASEECEPRTDARGSEAYKRDLVRVLTMRAVNRALERARGRK
jgi:aerobic carbon-monoxide dehydrogenase medium subunit